MWLCIWKEAEKPDLEYCLFRILFTLFFLFKYPNTFFLLPNFCFSAFQYAESLACWNIPAVMHEQWLECSRDSCNQVAVSSGFAPFELNYGYMPSFIRHFPAGEKPMRGIKAFAETALRQLAKAHNAIIERCVFQTANANKRRREEPEIYAGSLVYLSTKNLNLPKGQAKKLVPKYIGPYKVLQADHVHSRQTQLVHSKWRVLTPTRHL